MKSPQNFQHLHETGSTNRDLLEEATNGVQGMRALLADHQTEGRGRLGRDWHDDPLAMTPDGELVQAMLGSIRTDWAADHPGLPLVPLAIGLAAREACARWVVDDSALGLKWPNDLVTENPRRHIGGRGANWWLKIGGILVETQPLARSGRLAVVAGVGINLHPFAAPGTLNQEASSLSDLTDQVPTNTELFEALIAQVVTWTSALRSDPRELVRAYRTHCESIGRRVRAHIGERTVEGTGQNVADNGALLIEESSGSVVEVTFGDVSIEPS